MTVSHTSVFTPMAAELPPYMTEDTVKTINADLADDHVATMTGKGKQDLAAIAAEARAHGFPLSIVVLPSNPDHDSSLRDLAIELGKTQHGTVAVFSDDWMGTDSDSVSRVRLERAEDGAKFKGGGHSVEAAQAFVHRLEQPERVPWDGFTGVVLAGTVAAVVGLYFVKRRRAGSVTRANAPEVSAEAASIGDRDSVDDRVSH